MSNYLFNFEGHGVFSPDGRADGLTPYQIERHNLNLTVQELLAWSRQPDRFAGYINEHNVFTTWMGEPLGRVVQKWTQPYNLHRSYKITHYTIRGTNGAYYYGKHGDMQFLRVRRLTSKFWR